MVFLKVPPRYSLGTFGYLRRYDLETVRYQASSIFRIRCDTVSFAVSYASVTPNGDLP